MKKLTLMIVVMFLISFSINQSLASTPDLWLTLSKNTEGPRFIIDSTGNPFPLFGMARCQITAPLDEDPVYGGIDGLSKYFKDAGCNSIRLAVAAHNQLKPNADFIEDCGGYNEIGINKFIEQYVDPDVQAIIKNGMYVVLDLHEYPPSIPKGDTNPSLVIKYAREHYIPIWRELAKKYKDEPMVAMYELWNEPYAADQGSLKIGSDGIISEGTYKGYNWNENVRQFFIDCVKEVRKSDTKHMILVSDFNAGWGSAWATTWGKYKNQVDPGFNNVLYSAHAAKDHLLGFVYDDYWANTSTNNNICLQFGEVETEEWMASEQSMKDFIEMLKERSNTHHYSAFLWRPHKNILNSNDYIAVWSVFAKSYTKRINTTIIGSSSISSSQNSVLVSPTFSQNGSSSSIGTNKSDLNESIDINVSNYSKEEKLSNNIDPINQISSGSSNGNPIKKSQNIYMLIGITLILISILLIAWFYIKKKNK